MPSSESQRARWFAVGFIAYWVIVLVVDSLATRGATWPFEWRTLYWLTMSGVGGPSADYFKLIFWLIVPIILCAATMEWKWFSPKLDSKFDRWFIGGLAVIGMLAVLAVPLIPALRAMYPSLRWLDADAKPIFAIHYGIWLFTWLIGWELVHRYAIPRAVLAAWPSRAFVICIVLMPTLEGGYHVAQGKHPLECLGMAAFSAVLTAWAVTRKNALYPFLVHLAVEVALIALMLIV